MKPRFLIGSDLFAKHRAENVYYMTALYEVTGQPVVVLIDEYDTPVIEARQRGYQK